MDFHTWDTLEHLIDSQNGPELAALLKDLIDHQEIEHIEKNEVLNKVVFKNNLQLLQSVTPHLNTAVDDYLSFQMALYNGLNNVAITLAPPPHHWERVIDALRLDAYYGCLNRWSELAHDNTLDATILKKLEPDFYSSDAQEAMTAIEERMSVRISRTHLTEALRDIAPNARLSKKM